MPETIDLLLKELKLPAFLRHYLRHQEQAIEKNMVMSAIYRDFVNRKWRIVIRNVCNVGHEKPVCR